MTLQQLIYEIRESFNLMSDDSQITNDLIAFFIKSARSTILQQRYSDPRNIVPSIAYQSITVNIGINAQSTISIPTVIKTTGNPNAPIKITAKDIADTHLSIPLNVVTMERLPFVGHNIYTSDQIFCALDEQGTIIFNGHNNLYKLINKVVVRAIFEDPEAVYAITNSGQDFWTSKYPLAENDWLDVRKIVDPKITEILGIPRDTLNDETNEQLEDNPQGQVNQKYQNRYNRY